MRILIVSDSHRRNENLFEVIRRSGNLDMIIHCGDLECPLEHIQMEANCPVVAVKGNNDFFLPLEKELVFYIDEYKVMLTHGHHYNVSLGTDILVDEALSREVDIVMYGHTHRPHIEVKEDITIINPGSISYPRQGREATYIIMEKDRFGKIHYNLCHV